MATPDTNLFKFVCVRPAQLAAPDETRRGFIHDARAEASDAPQQLAHLTRDLSRPGAALAWWSQLDLTPIGPLVRGHRELLRLYQGIGEGRTAPPVSAALKQSGVADLNGAAGAHQLPAAWDALYIAHATGFDAGPRLEAPIAALRVLHFVDLLAEDAAPAASDALEALSASPVIAVWLDAVIRPAGGSPLAGPPTPAQSPTSADLVRTARLRQLADDLGSSSQLLETVTTAPPVAASPVETDAAQRPAGPARSFSVTTTPLLQAAVGSAISEQQVRILDRLGVTLATPVPIAARALESHVGRLTEQALDLAGDQEFRSYLQAAAGAVVSPQPAAPGSVSDVDVHGLIRPLGIGDLKVVKETLLAYVAGEVAHIENILKGESNERRYRKLDRTETTFSTLQEETRDTERDTQSTERFELKREAEQTIKEDMSIKAGLNVTASYGPIVATATGDFAYSTSKQEAQKSASNFARDVVDRSVSKVQTLTRTERTTKTLSEAEDTTTHGVDNATGTKHVIGIYRWVDKHYRAQIYNYGVRLMLEFVIPEPAAFYRAAHAGDAVKVDATPPAAFLNDFNFLDVMIGLRIPAPVRELRATDLTASTYMLYAARYGATGINPPPPLYESVGATLAKDGVADGVTVAITSDKLLVPAGYQLSYYRATASVVWGHQAKFSVQIGRDIYRPLNMKVANVDPIELTAVPESPPPHAEAAMETTEPGPSVKPGDPRPLSGIVPFSATSYDVRGFAVTVECVCKRDDAVALSKWQLETFEKIQAAYQALQTAYEQKVTQAKAGQGITIEGQNPATNRAVEQTELKKLCITMMTGQHFDQFNAMTASTPPEVDVLAALRQGPVIQFLEQAFEWEQMTYVFYPYYWARKSNWLPIAGVTDPDPLFQQFLTAGACRVVVPVPLAYIDAVLFLLQTPGPDLSKKVWGGGPRPTLGSDLYKSIAQELRDQTDDLAGAKPDPDVEPWEYKLPTTLVWLQPDDTLPTFPAS
jgi:hypothetical protein